MAPYRIAIIGYGKIAQDQHVPSIEGEPRFELAATVSRGGNGHPGVRCFTSHTDLLDNLDGITAVAICTPPSARFDIARDCILAGLDTLLEKPPGMTLGEVEELVKLAGEKGISLYTTWHAQDNPGVPTAAELLEGKRVRSMRIRWLENVRKWHPGQQWIWKAGGFGVFDPGINALSIATRIFPGTLIVRDAELTFAENHEAPIAAKITFASPAAEGELTAEFDWRETGGETWTIEVETSDGDRIELRDGGAHVYRNGEEVASPGRGEYPEIYRRFGDLLDSGASHIDLAPLRITADAFLLGRRLTTERFED